jgi:hypothetical protein
VEALHELLSEGPMPRGSLFLKRPPSSWTDRAHFQNVRLHPPLRRSQRTDQDLTPVTATCGLTQRDDELVLRFERVLGERLDWRDDVVEAAPAPPRFAPFVAW